MDVKFTNACDQVTLYRYPQTHQSKGQLRSLRAWDAADELLLEWFAEQQVGEACKLLVVNDSFGALAVSLRHYCPFSLSDSFLAHRATGDNLTLNGADESLVTLLSNGTALTEPVDIVLLKVPKTLALLEDQLYQLRKVIQPHTRVVAAAMAKHIHKSTLALFDKILGPVETSLAKKKARMIFCHPDKEQWQDSSPYPTYYPLENTSYQLANYSNVFSRASLDIGTRLFLAHIPMCNDAKTIIDLGCGNGVVGMIAAQRNPEADIHFFDESFMAVDCAQENFTTAFPDRSASFQANHCLHKVAPSSADLILNNPPFHQQNVVGDHIAWQMFCDAHRVLKTRGELWVIGNRHLQYHQKLKRLFGNCETVASDKKFVVLKAIKC